MRSKNINEIESAERQNTTNETVLETSILTDDELKGVSGGLGGRIEWIYTRQKVMS